MEKPVPCLLQLSLPHSLPGASQRKARGQRRVSGTVSLLYPAMLSDDVYRSAPLSLLFSLLLGSVRPLGLGNGAPGVLSTE